MTAIAGIIASAIGRGFTARTILNYIMQNYPQHAGAISNALAIGYTADKILKHLVEPNPKNPENSDAYLTDSEKTDRLDKQRTRKAAIGLAGGLAGITGLASLPFGMSSINTPPNTPASPLNPPLPGSPINPPPQLPQSPGQIATPQTPMPQGITPGQQLQLGVQNPVNQALNPADQGQIAEAANALPQEQAQPQTSIFDQLTQGLDIASLDAGTQQQLKFLGLISDKLQSEGKDINSPEFKRIASKIKKVLKGKGGTLMEEASRKPPELKEDMTTDIVASPGGVGSVTSVDNGKATIEVDGKSHKVDEKYLIKPPKEAAREAMELIKSFTPEQERSAHHMLNAYDEGEKKAFFVFHNGSAYVVDDITPEEYQELSEEIEQAKTTGENIIGKWATGEGSRGAGYNKVVKGIRDRKVQPDLKKKFRKLKVGYNLLREWQRLLNEK